LGRLYIRIKQSYKELKEKMLTGDELRLLSNKAFAECRIKNLSNKFRIALQ
jgi:DNA-directed RNA polymerase III subunit RPC1